MNRGDRVRLAPHRRALGPVREATFGLLMPTWSGIVERTSVESRFVDGILQLVTRVTCRHAAEDCGCHLEPRARRHLPLDDCPRCGGLGVAYRRTLDLSDLEIIERCSEHGGAAHG